MHFMLCVRSELLGRMPKLREPCAPIEQTRQIEEPYSCMNLGYECGST